MTDAPTDAPMPTNVVAALARIMGELPGIGRDQESGQGYNYRGIESITRHAQGLLAKYGVVFVPRVLSRSVKDFTINNKPWTEDCLEVEYTVYGPGGVEDKITVGPLFGLGRDNSDKGANKAQTQSFKYALIQTLCIGDAKDDPDREAAHESDPAPPPADPLWAECGWTGEQEWLDAWTELRGHTEQIRDPDMREAVKAWVRAQGVTRNKLTPEVAADWQAQIDQATPAVQDAPDTAQDAPGQPAAVAVDDDNGTPVAGQQEPVQAVSDETAGHDAVDVDPGELREMEAEIVATVSAYTTGELTEALKGRGLSIAGKNPERQKRLASAMLAELLEKTGAE